MNSIETFSLHLHSKSHQPKVLNYVKAPQFISSNRKHKSQTLSFQPSNRNFQSLFIANLSRYHIAQIPSSSLYNISSSLSGESKILKFLREKTVIFFVGSIIFLGFLCFNPRPSVALPGKSIASENLKEKRDTQTEKSEEEEMYKNLLEKEPRNVEALKVVLYGKMRRGKNKEALEFVRRLIDLEPREVEWKLLQAHCYELMGQLSTAKRLFKDILKERPFLLRALHGLALVMHKNYEGPAVFEMLSKVLGVARHEKRVTEERNIRILIAQMHVLKGELEEGLKLFEDLVKEDSRDFRPYLCQGIIYSLMGKKKEAAEQFEIYQTLVPDEFPQRGFLDDVVLAAKTKSGERIGKEFVAGFPYRKETTRTFFSSYN